MSRLSAAAGGLRRMGGQGKHLYIHAFFEQGGKTREMLVASYYIDSREQTARDCGRSAPHGRSDRNADRLIVYQRTGVSRLPAAAGGLPRVGGQDKHLYILRADCP